MSKRKADKGDKLTAQRAGSRKVIIVIGLALSLIAVSAGFAHWNGLRPSTPKIGNPQSVPVETASLNPSSPSKEYIYAGGRLVATEEPTTSQPPQTPQPPTGLTAVSGNGTVALSWLASPSAGVTGYRVKRSTVNGGPYSLLATVTGLSYSDNTATNGQTFYYVVTAINGSGGESVNSNQVIGTPTAPTSVQPPTGLTAVSGNGTVALSWSASPSSGVTGYRVKRSTVNGGPYSLLTTVTGLSYTDNTATNGTTFYYVVTAINGSGGESVNSNQVIGTPTAPTSVQPPTGLTAVSGNGSVALSWSASPSSGVTGYRVKRSTVDGGPYSLLTTVTGLSYTDNTATNGQVFYYVVTAINGSGGESVNSNQVIGTPTAPTSVQPPTGLTAVSGNGTVALSWLASPSAGVTGYRVKRSTVNGGPYSLLATVTGLSYSDNTATNGQTFYYVVTAINGSGGESANSNQAIGTPTAPPSGNCSTVSLVSGNGTPSYAEGNPSTAMWKVPLSGSVAKDPVSGFNSLFVADTDNHRIRMIYLEGPNAGISILIAGTGIAGYNLGGNDPFEAFFNGPQGILAITDANGVAQELVISDTDNHHIRKLLKPLSGTKWRSVHYSGSVLPIAPGFADGGPNNCKYSSPKGLTLGNDGNIYVADSGNGRIRRIDSLGNANTLASGFLSPTGITVSRATGMLYFTETDGNSIWQALTNGGPPTKIAGSSQGFLDATGLSAKFSKPFHLIWSNTTGGEVLYIADRKNHRVRKLTISTTAVTTFAGVGQGYLEGSCSSAKFNELRGVALGPAGEVYIMDSSNNRIRKAQ